MVKIALCGDSASGSSLGFVLMLVMRRAMIKRETVTVVAAHVKLCAKIRMDISKLFTRRAGGDQGEQWHTGLDCGSPAHENIRE